MFFIGSDSALQQRFDPRRNNALLSWLRGSPPDSEDPNPKVGPLNNGVGSIQVVRPPRETAFETSIMADAPVLDDGLSLKDRPQHDQHATCTESSKQFHIASNLIAPYQNKVTPDY